MFYVFGKKNNIKEVVYAVREEDGTLQFLMYFGQWEWYNADNFYAVSDI